jgi:quercetin dioxygenase-like cupin family protein
MYAESGFLKNDSFARSFTGIIYIGGSKLNIKSFKDGIPVIETEKIEARRIYSSANVNAVQINLQPGAVVETHTTDEDVFFLVLEGSSEIHIAEKRTIISEGQSVECRGGIEKGLVNNSANIFKVLIVKMDSVK